MPYLRDDRDRSNSNFFEPQFLLRGSAYWHIGISCFLPLGMVIQLLQLLKIVCLRLRSPALVGHAGASLSAQGLCPARRGLPPSDSSPRASQPVQARPRPPSSQSVDRASGRSDCTENASQAAQGRSSAALRGLQRNSFSLLVSYRTLAPCLGPRRVESQQDTLSRLFKATPTVTYSSHARAVAATLQEREVKP